MPWHLSRLRLYILTGQLLAVRIRLGIKCKLERCADAAAAADLSGDR
jgi:hypothetical protein